MDLGCGSGRDVKWFRDHGYEADGLDASEKLVRIASEKLGIPVKVGFIESWIADKAYDGIWCCASLVHLDDNRIDQFLSNLRHNLKKGGALFISVKEGIDSGNIEDGRYFRDFSEEALKALISHCKGLGIEKVWYTEDKMHRESFKWLNAIIIKNERQKH